MIITNTHRTALGIPGGAVLQPGVPTPVHDWEKIKAAPVVKAWVKAGILVEGASPDLQKSKFIPPVQVPEDSSVSGEPEQPADQPERDEKAELQAELESRGIEFDKRWGVPKLRAALAEAEEGTEDVPDDAEEGQD